MQEAKHPYAIDKALTEWERYRNKEENDYGYLTGKRFLAKNIVEAYKHTIKSDEQGNIVVPLYANAEGIALAFVGFDRRLKEPKEGQPKSYINGQKGIAVLQPRQITGIKNVVIAESYIDGLSYIEYSGLKPSETAIISTQGQVADREIEAIKTYLQTAQRYASIEKINIAMDNDKAGREFADRLIREIERLGVEAEIYKREPSAKDWNDALKRHKISKAKRAEELKKEIEEEQRQSYGRGMRL